MSTKSMRDLQPLEMVMTRSYGEVQFLGFLDDGLECQIGTWKEYVRKDGSKGKRPINPIVPTSELLLSDTPEPRPA
jgi:hypothetical protein